MLELRINPIVVKDLKNIGDYISERYATKTIKEIYGKFKNFQLFLGRERAFLNESAFE